MMSIILYNATILLKRDVAAFPSSFRGSMQELGKQAMLCYVLLLLMLITPPGQPFLRAGQSVHYVLMGRLLLDLTSLHSGPALRLRPSG
jgi:hypothetical protein